MVHNPLVRNCVVFIAGMFLIVACFLVSAFGIRSVIEGNMTVFYVAVLGLVFMFMAVIAFSWIVQRHHPFLGTHLNMPPPPAKHDDLIEREPL